MTLETWHEHGWLKPHRTSAQEIRGLLAAAQADLVEAEKDISADWRFAIAYSAALRLCSVVLFAAGYRAVREQKHYRTIAALPLVLGADVSELAEFLDHCRTKRHEVTYETVGVVSREEAEELIGAVRELERHVRDWLAREHAEFL